MRSVPFTTAFACIAALSAAACADADTETEVEADAASEAEISTDETAAVEIDPAEAAYNAVLETAPDSAWRTVEAENLLKISTSEGDVWVELAEEWTPTHTARMRELARSDWFDFKVWHRVLNGFMAQGGGALDNPNIIAPTTPMPAEFMLRRDPNTTPVSEIQQRFINPRSNRTRAPAGFWNGMPAGTQPAAAAGIMGDGRVDSWLIHCDGAAAMARTSDPNSGNAQFYIVRGDAEHLNTQYTVWGWVRSGLEVVYQLNEGTLGQDRGFRPSIIEDVEVASDLPEGERATVQVIDTQSEAFAGYLAALEAANGSLPDVCSIKVPTRVVE